MDSFKNFAKSTILTGGFADTVVQLTVAGDANARFPAVPFNATIWNGTDYADPADDPNREIVRVTGKNNTNGLLTVTRGQEGTTAVDHADGTKVYRIIAGFTAKTMNEIAPVDSPTFSGTVIAGTVQVNTSLTTLTKAADTNTTEVATTAFVIGQASAVTPTAPGTGAVGTSKRYMRADAVIPTDTTRAPIASPTFTGTVNAGSGDLQINGYRLQRFTVTIFNNGGTLQHRVITTISDSTTSGSYASKITGASATLANTPAVAAGVDFTSGAGIVSGATELLLNTAAQASGEFTALAVLAQNSTATQTVLATCVQRSDNVNGTTTRRLAIKLTSLGSAFLINTTNIAAGKQIDIDVLGFVA